MSRHKIMVLILMQFRQFGSAHQEHVLVDAMKQISDTNHLPFALEVLI